MPAASGRIGPAHVPLRDHAHHAILERILHGELKPGDRIRDAVLARELGVSRTPVREALHRLEREGYLEADGNRRVFVRPLAAGEVDDVYPVLAAMEVVAVRTTAPMTDDQHARLNAVNAELQAETLPDRRIELEMKWHCMLVEPCRNNYLLGTIDSIRQVTRRYEYAYILDVGAVPVCTRSYSLIAAHLFVQEVDAAALLLETAWRFRRETIMDWMRVHGGAPPPV
jgi:DNA-binding GntR family transcriptional regulator